MSMIIEGALRRLVADPHTRDKAVRAMERATERQPNSEWLKMRALAWINRHELEARARRLQDADYSHEDVMDDSPEAHRNAADIQRILQAFGFELGPDGVDGYIGGPPGKPVVLELEECAELIQQGSPREKLLGIRQAGPTESWTRDATRRLQTFIGQFGLPDGRTDLRRDCLARPDGLFGSLTLAGLSAFLHENVQPQTMS